MINYYINNNEIDKARELLNENNINLVYGKEGNALNIAICMGQLKFAIELIDLGIDVNQINYDTFETTPLHRACNNNPSYELLKSLLENGADVNAKDIEGDTPLDWLIGCEVDNFLECAELLISYGGKISSKIWVIENDLIFKQIKQVNSLIRKRKIKKIKQILNEQKSKK